MVPPLLSGPEEKDDQVGCMPICDWSGSGADLDIRKMTLGPEHTLVDLGSQKAT